MLLVDFSLYFFRMWYGAPPLTTKGGVPSGFEFMMLKNLEALAREYGEIILCMDTGGKNERKKLNSKYKDNRQEVEDSLFPRLQNLMKALNSKYAFAKGEGMEADDVMFSLSRNTECQIYTNDKDLFQAIGPNVSVITTFRGTNTVWTVERLFEKFVIRPWHWVYYRALCGDTSDNLPGIYRIRKRLVAEACRACVMAPESMPNSTSLSLILAYLYRKASANELMRLDSFTDSGNHESNLAIMKPINREVKITPANEKLAKEYDRVLTQYELYSLREETDF